MLPHTVLLILALWTAWRPAETVAVTPVIVSLVVLALVPWAHRRSDPERLVTGLAVSSVVLVAVMSSAVGGWDRANALVEVSLAISVVTLVWIGSRSVPPEHHVRLFALGVSALTFWAVWQVTTGFELAQSAVDTLPVALRTNAVERLTSGRAFASLLLPGHLAAMLATALPLLLAGVGRGLRSVPWLLGSLLCVVGLVLTRSPVGLGLAVLAVLALLAKRRSRLLVVGCVVLAVALVAVAVWRPDMGQLDPVRLRLDNWQTAWWAWSTSPVVGVGAGSFGQVIRAVPLEVGNLPAHAHSLPMEWFAELGVVGLLAFAAAALWLTGALRRLWTLRPELAIGLAVIPLHNLVDFSLYTSGVALPWAVLLGWGVANVTKPVDNGASAATGRTVLVTAAALGVALSLLHMTSRSLETAALGTELAAQRFDDAVRASRIAPWRVDPVTLAASAALELHRPEALREAGELLEARRWLRPDSASLADASSRVLIARGRVPSGAADLYGAARSQPASSARREMWESLRNQLEAEYEQAHR